MNLDYWLRKAPRPHTVLADDRQIAVSNNARALKELSATVKAMDPAKLTCLDKDGNVIRSIVLEDDDDKPSAAGSPGMSDLQLFAKLLADGYEHGRRANQPIIDSAMQFVETQASRLVKAEAEIERLRAHIFRLNQQIAELSNAPAPAEDSIMGALVAGALQSQMPGAAAANMGGVTPFKNGAKK